MMSTRQPPSQSTADTVLMKGCLGGVALAVVFLLIGGIMYLLLSRVHLPRNIVLLISIASGPLLGLALLMIGYVLLLTRR